MVFTFFVLVHTNLICCNDHPISYTAFTESKETLKAPISCHRQASQHLIVVICITIIVITKFINREKDLSFLEKRYEEASAQVIVLYGGR